MQIDIKGTNLELTPALKDYINEKVGSLEKIFDRAIMARVEVGLTTRHHQKGNIFRAEINLDVPQKQLLRAEAVRDDMYLAINEAKADLERQLKKYKAKMTDRVGLLLFFIALSLFGSANFAGAQAGIDPEQQPLIRLLREFSVFINIVLVILVLLLAISLHGALKYLGGKASFSSKMVLIWHFLSKEPAQIFSQQVQRDKTGTYLLPFESYRRLHNMGQKSLLRVLGLIILQVSILVFLIYGLSYIGHYTRASADNSIESNNFILELDK